MSDPLQTRKLTPDEAFAEFRLWCRYEFAPRESTLAQLRPETTLRELHQLFDIECELGFLDAYFGFVLELGWWDQWTPHSTVGELCAGLADRIEVPVVEPVTILGRKCETAGAFLTLKRMLASDGANVAEMAPSSGIGSYVRQHPRPFQRFRLAFPGSSPIVQKLNTLQALGCLLVVGTAFFWLTGCLCGWKDLAVLVAFPIVMVGGLLLILGRLYQNRFGHTFIEGVGRRPTFRDYIYALHGRRRQAGTA